MPATIGRLSAGVGRRHPGTVRQGIVDNRVNESEAGVSPVAPDRSTVLWC